MLFKGLLLTAALLAVFHFSSGAFNLQTCYHCEYFDYHGSNETNNEKCKENPPPNEFLKNCSDLVEAGATQPTEWQCIKVTGRIEIDEENYNYVKRTCSPGRNYDTCKDCKDTKSYETRHGFVKRGKHCVCDDNNNCNAANGLPISIVTITASLLVGAALKF